MAGAAGGPPSSTARGWVDKRIALVLPTLYKPFTWDKERFPDPPKLIADLAAQGFKTITIVDPHPKKERGYVPYDSGIAGGHFVKNPDGSVYEAPVWPSQAERNPGPSVFADFSRPATREWWAGSIARSSTWVWPGSGTT